MPKIEPVSDTAHLEPCEFPTNDASLWRSITAKSGINVAAKKSKNPFSRCTFMHVQEPRWFPLDCAYSNRSCLGMLLMNGKEHEPVAE